MNKREWCVIDARFLEHLVDSDEPLFADDSTCALEEIVKRGMTLPLESDGSTI